MQDPILALRGAAIASIDVSYGHLFLRTENGIVLKIANETELHLARSYETGAVITDVNMEASAIKLAIGADS